MNIIPLFSHHRTVVLSAKTPDLDAAEEQKRHDDLTRIISDMLPYLDAYQCLGSYKCEQEKSIAVTNCDSHDLLKLDDIASAFMQESTLLIDSAGHGSLRFQSDGKPHEEIGKLEWISPADKLKHEAWTQILSNAKTFIFV